MGRPASPLAPERFPALPDVVGVRLASASVGVRYAGRTDLLVAELARGSTVAGCYTRSLTASAPVDWCRAAQVGGRIRAIIANSGNANAFTGAEGWAATRATAEAAAAIFGCPANEVFIASTGVIGEPLPVQRITDGLPAAAAALAQGGWENAARAIMTTDTFPKAAGRRFEMDGRPIAICGIAKGSGMIAPDMATMLAFLFTDAAIGPQALQECLEQVVRRSFNCVTVDGDTSTSDSVILGATGLAGNVPITDPADPALAPFRTALAEVAIDLAKQVARDGEGAEKLITITVTGAADDEAARKIGLAIANSPLVKTAIAGEDANWGRIVMAVGKSGERADRDRLKIVIGGVAVAAQGRRVSDYDEAPVAAHIRTRDIRIEVDVGVGTGRAEVWTCDLTHRYLDINAGYRS